MKEYLTKMTEKTEIRLQKYMADSGLMSRRAAEAEILRGAVKVNGITAEIGQKIDPDSDRVEYQGKVVKIGFKKYIYIMLNKPRGYVTTASDEKGRPTVVGLCHDIQERIYPVGRLDMDSDGLLLLTNDGELANGLTHPRHTVPKIYHAEIEGVVDSASVKRLSSPMVIDGYEIMPVKCRVISVKKDTRRGDTSVIEMELFEGRNRQIRKMCELCSLNLKRLTRVAIGDLKLGNLKSGHWRHLTKTQVEYLKKSIRIK